MKRLGGALVAILVALAFMGLAFAQAPAKPAEKPAPAAPAKPAEPAKPAAPVEKPMKPKRATGEVVSADPAMKTLVVKVKDKELTFSVTEKAAKALADLKPGDKVMVRYTEADGKLTASAITKAKPKMKAEKPAPAEAAPMAPAKPAEKPAEKPK